MKKNKSNMLYRASEDTAPAPPHERGEPELLMPAGNLDKLKIAVKNGANAVYFGAQQFNMRQTANNFSTEDLEEGINFCHAYGARAYITINIALKDSEIEGALELAKEVYKLGTDAVIVQDLGLVSLLRELLPGLELHASTQLTCNNIQGAEFLVEHGFKKIVLARELDLKQIKEVSDYLHSKDVEVEVFVHGAECFSYSGQCLFSSFAFNKSGNRGRCLQPCRLSYHTTQEEGRFLSMKDLCTYEHIDKLIEAGVDSFKVEGRLKSEEYIQNVARVYRKQIDNYYKESSEPTKGEITEMKKSYLRDHNTCYVLDEEERTTITTLGSLGLPACRVIGFKGKAPIVEIIHDLNKSDKLTQIIEEEYTNLFVLGISDRDRELNFARAGQKVVLKFRERPYLKIDEILYLTSPKQFNPGKTLMIEYDLNIYAKYGEKLKVQVKIPKLKDDKTLPYTIDVDFDFVVDTAKKIPTTSEIIKEKVFGEFYFFKPGEFECTIAKNSFIPLSELKNLKRTIAKTVKSELFLTWELNEDEFKSRKAILLSRDAFPEKKYRYNEQKFYIFVDEDKEEVIDKTKELSCEKIFYFSNEIGAKNNFPEKALVKAQNIQTTKELDKFEKMAIERKWNIVCANIGSLQVALRNKLGFWIDREMNCFNSIQMNYFSALGAQKIIPSIELSLGEMLALSQHSKIIVPVFYYPLLITSKAYAKKNIFKKNSFTLVDRKEFDYRVRFEAGLMKIYNPKPVDMLYELEQFNRFASIAIDLKETHTKEAIALLRFYVDKINQRKPTKKSKFTRGHYDKAVI